jgi:hypothetical protein
MGYPIGDRRADLHRARPGADEGDALAVENNVCRPFGRVELEALEGLPAGEVGQSRAVEDADRADDHVRGDRLLRAVGVPDPEIPLHARLVVGSLEHLRLVAHVLQAADLVHDPREVGL